LPNGWRANVMHPEEIKIMAGKQWRSRLY